MQHVIDRRCLFLKLNSDFLPSAITVINNTERGQNMNLSQVLLNPF